jgi:hypothetical protein
MADIFKDIVPSILQTKKDVLEDEKDYNAFLVNRALSYHIDCILYANQMNMNSKIDNKLQFHFFLNTIRPMKRKFQAWQKTEKAEDLNIVKEYFCYSNEKAKSALRILNKQQISSIKEKLEKGGVKK